MGRAVTVGWWRRNAVALVALAVLIPATIAAIGVNEWSQYDAGHPTRPMLVKPGESIDYAGAQLSRARGAFIDDPSAPSGSRVVRAIVLVEPGETPISCSTPELRELDGGERRWEEASGELDLPYDPEAHSFCDSELAIRYSLTLYYLVPADAAGPFTIEFAASGTLPEYLRLVIEP